MDVTGQKDAPSLEEVLLQIEEIIERMESREITLDESFSLYQEGVEKLKSCNEMLDAVEKKIQILDAEGEPEEWE